MNKQFLSLLLLTSFAGTMSASTALVPYVKPAFTLVGGVASFGAKASAFMATVGSKFAGLGGTAQEALIVTPLAGAGVATGTILSNNAGIANITTPLVDAAANATATLLKDHGFSSVEAMETAIELAQGKTPEAMAIATQFGCKSPIGLELAIRGVQDQARAKALVEYNALPFLEKANLAVRSAASAVKSSVSHGAQVVVDAAKSHPKTAIATGVVAASALGYLGYRYFTASHSISLTEQEMVNFEIHMNRAKSLGSKINRTPSFNDVTIIESVFTTEATGLPKKAVAALNEYVAVSCKLADFKYLSRNNYMTDERKALKQQLEARLAQVTAKLPVAA